MSNIDYHTMSDRELVDRLEKGEMQTNPEFYGVDIAKLSPGARSARSEAGHRF